FETDEYERYRIHEERLKEKHYQLIENLHSKHQATRNELLFVQRQKLEQCIEYETRKLQELQSTFESDWMEFRNTQKTRKLQSISLPYSNGTFLRTQLKPFATTVVRSPVLSSHAPVILRSTGSHRIPSWHTWPNNDLNNDEQFWAISNASDNILF
ncbi:unnamed protein product, partial [Adineta steineri]